MFLIYVICMYGVIYIKQSCVLVDVVFKKSKRLKCDVALEADDTMAIMEHKMCDITLKKVAY